MPCWSVPEIGSHFISSWVSSIFLMISCLLAEDSRNQVIITNQARLSLHHDQWYEESSSVSKDLASKHFA